jgi:hypothetical protein
LRRHMSAFWGKADIPQASRLKLYGYKSCGGDASDAPASSTAT